MKRSTFRRRRHTKLNEQLPAYGNDTGPRHWISWTGGPSKWGPAERIKGGSIRLNRGTGEGTARAIARERARS